METAREFQVQNPLNGNSEQLASGNAITVPTTCTSSIGRSNAQPTECRPTWSGRPMAYCRLVPSAYYFSCHPMFPPWQPSSMAVVPAVNNALVALFVIRSSTVAFVHKALWHFLVYRILWFTCVWCMFRNTLLCHSTIVLSSDIPKIMRSDPSSIFLATAILACSSSTTLGLSSWPIPPISATNYAANSGFAPSLNLHIYSIF